MSDSLGILQSIAESSSAGVITIDRDGVVKSFSRGAERLFGYHASDVVDRNVSMLMPEPYRSGHDGYLSHYLDTGEERVIGAGREVLGLRRDGTTFPMHLAVGAFDVDGESMFAGMIVDVSADVASRQALQESETLFRQLVESIEEVFILRTAAPYRYVYISPAVERIFGLTAQEAMSSPERFLAFAHPDDADYVREAMARANHQPQVEVEYRIVRGDGETRWVWTRYRHVEVRPGDQPLLAVVVSDITAQKEAQRAELSARAEAERANAAKTEFLSRMSHELRTPMNAILGFAQLLEMDELELTQRESVRQILRGGRHLLDLINEVLDISRIDAGELALSPEPVLLSDVVTEVMDLVAPLVAARELTVVAPSGVECRDYVLADRQRLMQVLLNLVSNSIKYNRKDGEIHLNCAVRAADMVAVTVSDTGIGMGEAEVARLFTPFDRLGRESTGEEGTGVGLALSQRLVQLMGGWIEVHSERGVGSHFTVVLPLAHGDDPSLGLHTRHGEDHAVPPAQVTGGSTTLTVTYIEDNLANVRLMERLAERRPGVSLVHAIQGRLGLDLVASSPPDLIFLDLHLPDMSGEEVLRRLMAEPATRDIPTVVVSADASPTQVRRVMEIGARGYLTKPFDVEEVLTWFDEILGGKRGRS